jgi:hypothetical protein
VTLCPFIFLEQKYTVRQYIRIRLEFAERGLIYRTVPTLSRLPDQALPNPKIQILFEADRNACHSSQALLCQVGQWRLDQRVEMFPQIWPISILAEFLIF